MTKSEFISKIKTLAKQAYAAKTGQPAPEPNKFPILGKFDSLNAIMNDLFDFQYEPFVADVQWIAPKPSTFRIKLINDGHFYISYHGQTNGKGIYIAQVEGKRYFLESLADQQRASESIARLLKYAKPFVEKEDLSDLETTADTPPESPAAISPEAPEGPELETPPESPAA